MSGFSVGDGLSYPTLWASHDQVDGEPFFVLVHQEGSVALVTLDYIRDNMQQVYNGDLNIPEMYYALYAKFPESDSLEQVSLSFSEESGTIKLNVISELATMWACDL